MPPVKILSYNVLYPPYAEAHKKNQQQFHSANWGERLAKKIVPNIANADPDIVLIQEIAADQLETLADQLNRPGLGDYYTYGFAAHRNAQGQKKGDGVAIFYKAKRFRQIDEWKTTYESARTVTASAGGQAALICDLADTEGKVFRVCNVHLRGGQDRRLGDDHLRNIQDRLEELPHTENVHAFIIGGDMNQDAKPTTGQYYNRLDILRNEDRYQDDGSKAISEPLTNRRIDWILFKSGKDTASITSRPIPLKPLDGASDHFPICTELSLQGNALRYDDIKGEDADRDQQWKRTHLAPRTARSSSLYKKGKTIFAICTVLCTAVAVGARLWRIHHRTTDASETVPETSVSADSPPITNSSLPSNVSEIVQSNVTQTSLP